MAAFFSGVPWDVAWSAAPHYLTALMIIKGEVDGGDFDLDAWAWRERT